jgi:hypothetical protein
MTKEPTVTSDGSQSRDADLPRTLAAPARRALAGAGYTSLDQLTAVTEQELLRLHGMGPNAIRQLKAALADHGLALAAEQGPQE